MTPQTHPAAFAYAAARCEARRLADRYASQAERIAQGNKVVKTGAAARRESMRGWTGVRTVLGIDQSVTDPGLVLSRAAELVPEAPARGSAQPLPAAKGRGVRGNRPPKRTNVRGTR